MSTFQGEVTQASRGLIRDTSNSLKIHFGAGWLHMIIKGNIILNIFMIQTLCTAMQLFKGSYFSVDAVSRHFWTNSAIANGTVARIYELCYTRFKVEYERSYIFKALPVKQ